jgi:hypothetical protein
MSKKQTIDEIDDGMDITDEMIDAERRQYVDDYIDYLEEDLDFENE